MDDKIYYPTTRQFRVSVYTFLYRQQMPLHYIRKHMNHLSEDMAAYYIQPQKNLEKEYSETLSKSRLAQFEKIDDAIQNRISEIEKAKEILKSTGVNISTISTETNISRKTFYNNELLKKYVASYSTSDEDKVALASDLEKLKFKNNELLKQIHGFVLKDIETENLRHEIKELNREIQSLQSQNEFLEQQFEEVQGELAKAKGQLATKNIIQFNPK